MKGNIFEYSIESLPRCVKKKKWNLQIKTVKSNSVTGERGVEGEEMNRQKQN
jgi:hypothetical protein